MAQQDARATADAAPAPLRIAHGISALGIIAIFLAPHLANHLHSSLGLTPSVRRRRRCATSLVRSFYNRCWLRCSCLRSPAACTSLRIPTPGRSTVSAPSRSRAVFFLAAYVLEHMNSAFGFAHLYLGIDSDWALATAASELVKDAWELA